MQLCRGLVVDLRVCAETVAATTAGLCRSSLFLVAVQRPCTATAAQICWLECPLPYAGQITCIAIPRCVSATRYDRGLLRNAHRAHNTALASLSMHIVHIITLSALPALPAV
jgi:hypothetical protein